MHVASDALAAMIAQAYDCYPEEACGLLVGDPADGHVLRFVACRNTAASAKVYDIDPRDYLRIERQAEDERLAIVGVMHSHTHSEPYPSPTDVRQAPDPGWHYVIVSLKRQAPETRSYHIADDLISEEPITVV